MSEEERFRLQGWHVLLSVFLIFLFTLFYQGLWGDPSALPTVLIGTEAPAFAGPDVMSGEHLALKQFDGKVVMLNFWASWCQECRIEHENLLAIYKQFGNHPDFVMLGINYQDRLENARKYIEVYGVPFHNVRDLEGAISIGFGVFGVPETFVIDRNGIIQHKQIGPIIGPSYTYLRDAVLPSILRGDAPISS